MSTPDTEHRPMRSLHLAQASVIGILLVVAILFFSIVSPFFLSFDNIVNLLTTMALAGILAAPATVLLVAGQIDLSVGAAAAVCGVLLAEQVPGLGIGWAVVVAVVAGIGIGLINGTLVTMLGLSSLAVTIGSLALLRGLAFLLPSGGPVGLTDFEGLGNGRPLLNIPLPVYLFAAVMLVTFAVLRYTRCGHGAYAIGRRPAGRRLGGFAAKRLVLVAFVASGAAAALVGMILASQLGTGVPNVGIGLELTVLTSVLLGGASLAGGRGSIPGTVLALLLLSVLDNGMSLLNVTSYWQQFTSGALLLIALVVDGLRTTLARRRNRRSMTAR